MSIIAMSSKVRDVDGDCVTTGTNEYGVTLHIGVGKDGFGAGTLLEPEAALEIASALEEAARIVLRAQGKIQPEEKETK